MLQEERREREKQLSETKDALRLMREKLQATSEQVMLMQANFVDTEKQWLDEKTRLEIKTKDLAEKHEAQVSAMIHKVILFSQRTDKWCYRHPYI